MGTKGSTMLQPLWRGLPPMDASAVPGAASCALPAHPEAVQGARRFAGSTLRRWELAALHDDVALVVTELVTNALRHAIPKATGALEPPRRGAPGTPGAAYDGTDLPPGAAPERSTPRGTQQAEVRLDLIRWTSRLVCAVRDPSEQSPVTGHAGFAAESGRGLFLVESFSDSWGWHPHVGPPSGKVVWALFLLPRAS